MATLGILVGGGPAPGLNGVLQAVTQAALARGWTVLGIPEGFKHLIAGDPSKARRLTLADVEAIGQRGGSILFTSRANPAKEEGGIGKVLATLQQLGITHLVTVGGDDTASSAARVAEASQGKLRVVHVPKTIDNDLPLPQGIPTFGFETARGLGAQLLRNLVEDARTTRRYYLVTVMGRTAGHLAAGVAMSAGAHLCLVPEEFGPKVRFQEVLDRVEAAVGHRIAAGQPFGTFVLAEGLLNRMDPTDFAALQDVERDEHGHPRVSEISLGGVLKSSLGPALKARGVKADFVAKELGYELRCQDPNAFDAAYTRALGLGAVQVLAEGKESHALVTIQDGKVVPLRLDDLRDPTTKKVRVRTFDPTQAAWRAHAALEARLRPSDLQGERLGALAKALKLDEKQFLGRFGGLAEASP
jgi:ATP-dependent phosphofructokinase / diphosphate-dependent phosphofructokinase